MAVMEKKKKKVPESIRKCNWMTSQKTRALVRSKMVCGWGYESWCWRRVFIFSWLSRLLAMAPPYVRRIFCKLPWLSGTYQARAKVRRARWWFFFVFFLFQIKWRPSVDIHWWRWRGPPGIRSAIRLTKQTAPGTLGFVQTNGVAHRSRPWTWR